MRPHQQLRFGGGDRVGADGLNQGGTAEITALEQNAQGRFCFL
jgi:hypothetical protein